MNRVDNTWRQSLEDHIPRDIEQLATALSAVFSNMPEEYAQTVDILRYVRHRFHDELARVIEPRLNQELSGMSLETEAEKRTVATWVNSQLRLLGLTIECPTTKMPGILIVDHASDAKRTARFRIQVRREGGATRKSMATSKAPHLRIIENTPLRVSHARWSDKIRPPVGRSGGRDLSELGD